MIVDTHRAIVNKPSQKSDKTVKKKCHIMQREYTLSEVKTHCKPEDCWVVINELVYDVTQFLKLHPGGAAALKRVAG